MWTRWACHQASRSASALTGALGLSRRWISSGSRFAALWGNADYGRLGLGHLYSQWKPAICPAFDGSNDNSLRAIACGGAHTLFLTEKGHVYATGLNDFGQLGIPSVGSHVLEPLEVPGILKEVIHISAGYRHSSAITEKNCCCPQITAVHSIAILLSTNRCHLQNSVVHSIGVCCPQTGAIIAVHSVAV